MGDCQQIPQSNSNWKETQHTHDSGIPTPQIQIPESFQLLISSPNTSSSYPNSSVLPDFSTTTTTDIQETTTTFFNTSKMHHPNPSGDANQPARSLLPKDSSENPQSSPMATGSGERPVSGQSLVSGTPAPIGLGIIFPAEQGNTQSQGFNNAQSANKPFVFDPSRPAFVPGSASFQYKVPAVPQHIGKNNGKVRTSKHGASSHFNKFANSNHQIFGSAEASTSGGPANFPVKTEATANDRQQEIIRANDARFTEEAVPFHNHNNAFGAPQLDGHHPPSAVANGHQGHNSAAFNQANAVPNQFAGARSQIVPGYGQGKISDANFRYKSNPEN